MNADQLYEGLGVEDGSCWSRGWEGTERMYGAVGENSIDFSPIPPYNPRTVWEQRFVSMGGTLNFLRRKEYEGAQV